LSRTPDIAEVAVIGILILWGETLALVVRRPGASLAAEEPARG
jgi:hypothetical protein